MASDKVKAIGAPFAAVAVAALAAGVIIAWIPWELSLLVAIAALGVLGLAVVRIAVRPAGVAATSDEAEEIEDARLKPARLAYYVGAGTIGLLTIRPAMDFAASDWIFLASLGLTAMIVLTQGVPVPFHVPRAIVVGVLMFAIGGLVSSLDAVSPNASTMVVVRMLYLTLVWFWLGTIVLQRRSHVHNAVAAWVGSAAISSSGAVAQFYLGDVIPGGGLAWGRMTGFTPHWNNLGGLAATALVPALMLAIDSPRGWMKIYGFASTGLITAGLLLSGSVGGLLAASGATVLWLALRGVSLRIVMGLGAVVATGFVLMSATGVTDAPSPLHRIAKVTSEEEARRGTGGTIFTRLEGWSDAWERIGTNPLVGVGLDEASALAITEGAVHNMLLGPWLTAGILGLIGVLFIIGGSLVTGIRVLKNSPPKLRSSTAALLAALAGFVQFGMGEPILYVRYGWFPTALLIALQAQQLRARTSAVSHRGATSYETSLARRGALAVPYS